MGILSHALFEFPFIQAHLGVPGVTANVPEEGEAEQVTAEAAHDVSAIAHSLRLGNALKYHLVDMAAFFLAEGLEGLYISIC